MLTRVPPPDRDAWVDRVFGLQELPEDGPELPQGCAPYLPCSVDAVLAAVDQAEISSSDVFVDVGSGVGRTGLLVHLLTGATAIGIEIQSALVALSRKCAQELAVDRFVVVEGDASRLARYIALGSVFFFYCPFSGARLNGVIDGLEAIAQTRQLRVCGVDLRFPPRPWLQATPGNRPDLVVYRANGGLRRV